MRGNSTDFLEHHIAFSYRMGSPLAGNLEIFAASHREKETQKHELVKNNKNRQVGARISSLRGRKEGTADSVCRGCCSCIP